MRSLLAAVSLALVLHSPQVIRPAVASGPKSRDASAGLRERMRGVLEGHRARGGFPGATAAARLPDGRTLSVAVGLADRESKRPIRTRSRMLAGSVGKTFFAALALQLVAEGRLRLDDPVKKHLGRAPWFSRLPNGERLTVRMLMTHTSGLGGYDEKFMRGLVKEPARERSREELVESLLDKKPLAAAGEKFEYSDLNYILLALVCEEATGRAAVGEIRRRLLRPLNLRDTTPSDRAVLPGLVPGYAGANNPFGGDAMMKGGRLVLNPQFEWAGGGYASTASDLARWMAAFCEGRAFDRRLLPDVTGSAVDAPSIGEGAKYGLGIHVERTPLGTACGHGGFFPGYVSSVFYYPEHKLSVAVQFNTSDDSLFKASAREVVDDLASALVGRPSK